MMLCRRVDGPRDVSKGLFVFFFRDLWFFLDFVEFSWFNVTQLSVTLLSNVIGSKKNLFHIAGTCQQLVSETALDVASVCLHTRRGKKCTVAEDLLAAIHRVNPHFIADLSFWDLWWAKCL